MEYEERQLLLEMAAMLLEMNADRVATGRLARAMQPVEAMQEVIRAGLCMANSTFVVTKPDVQTTFTVGPSPDSKA